MSARSGKLRHVARASWQERNPGAPRLRFMTPEDAEAARPLTPEEDVPPEVLRIAREMVTAELLSRWGSTAERLQRAMRRLHSSGLQQGHIIHATKQARKTTMDAAEAEKLFLPDELAEAKLDDNTVLVTEVSNDPEGLSGVSLRTKSGDLRRAIGDYTTPDAALIIEAGHRLGLKVRVR